MENFKRVLFTGAVVVSNTYGHPELSVGCKIRAEIVSPLFKEQPLTRVLEMMGERGCILPLPRCLDIAKDAFAVEIYSHLDFSSGKLFALAQENALEKEMYPQGRIYKVPYINSDKGKTGHGSMFFFENDEVYRCYYSQRGQIREGHEWEPGLNKGVQLFPFSSLNDPKEYLILLYRV